MMLLLMVVLIDSEFVNGFVDGRVSLLPIRGNAHKTKMRSMKPFILTIVLAQSDSQRDGFHPKLGMRSFLRVASRRL